jgi:hypothetical protein
LVIELKGGIILKREAKLDSTKKYRYLLRREWDETKPHVVWIMLNPSTADHEEDDPTIEACIRFTKKWGYGSFEVVNLFAYRATKPSELKNLDKDVAIGAESLTYIRDALERADLIVAAWGSNGKTHKRNQDDELILLLKDYQLKCLHILTDGDPRHPLYFSTDSPLQDFELRKIIKVRPTVKRKITSKEGILNVLSF